MNFSSLRSAAGLFFLTGIAWASVPPPTGQGSDYVLQTGPAVVVTKPASNWGSQPGAQWIGPVADATKNHPSSGEGNFIYTLTFNVTDPSKANLTASILAHPDVDISLNSTFLRGGISTVDVP